MRQPYTFTKSKQLWEKAQSLVANGAQPTRQPEYDEQPIYFDRAKGCRMWDVDGNEFIDLLCSIGPITLGYAYDRIDDAARAVMKSSFQSSLNHPLQLELAEILIDAIPCAERVRLFKTGTEATQSAARLARCITQRAHIARHGYHGWADMWWYGKGLESGIDTDAWRKIPPFDGTAEGLDKVFRETGEKFAAVILCPVDTRPFTKENFQNIVDVAHTHGALVIFDEVKSCFRRSLGGAQEVLDVMPDLTTISKGMANGYPISALVGKADYMDSMNKTPTAGTFSVEALSIAAAIATVKEMREKNVCDHLAQVGQRLIDGLNKLVDNHGLEGPRAYADPFPATPRFVFDVEAAKVEDFSNPAHLFFFGECYRYGLFFSSWHVAFVNFSHQNDDIDEALEICDLALAKTKKKFPGKWPGQRG